KLAQLENIRISEIISCQLVNSTGEVTDIESKLNVSDSILKVTFLRPITITEKLNLKIELK
ncbi:unnamed protein product, partial [marine sediment metagenome]